MKISQGMKLVSCNGPQPWALDSTLPNLKHNFLVELCQGVRSTNRRLVGQQGRPGCSRSHKADGVPQFPSRSWEAAKFDVSQPYVLCLLEHPGSTAHTSTPKHSSVSAYATLSFILANRMATNKEKDKSSFWKTATPLKSEGKHACGARPDRRCPAGWGLGT